jgi:VIT1/CCC1 family predicted Fe2+/Mn2+ transporter
MIALDLLNVTGLENVTGAAQQGVQALIGNWGMLVGALILIAGAFVLMYVFKQLVANAIAGIIALLVIVYILGIPIPLTPLIMLVSVLGGLGGVGAVFIASFLGWL